MMINRDSKLPLYIQIQEHVLELIRSEALKPGDGVLSEHEFADQTGVSRLTVRKAYSELAKRGVLQTVQGKGTFVVEQLEPAMVGLARENDVPPNRTIGILFPEVTEYFGRILREIERRASEANYALHVMFNDSIKKDRYAVEHMLAQNLAGIILTPFRRRESGVLIDSYERLVASGLPFVMIGRPPFHIACDAIYVDDTVGVFDACQALVDLGHQEFVFLYNSATADPQGLFERRDGFTRAHQALQRGDEMRTLDVSSPRWHESLRALLLAPTPVTAIVAEGDRAAASAYTVIVECGKRVGADISVIGYDNSSICESLQVKLTSVAPNRALLGRYAYELLQTRMNLDPERNQEPVSRHMVVKPRLVVRASIGPGPQRSPGVE